MRGSRLRRLPQITVGLLACLAVLLLASCKSGSGSGTTPPTINIVIVPTTITSIDAGSTGSLTFTAQLGADTTNAGVTWCLPDSTGKCAGITGTFATNTACAGVGVMAGNCGALVGVTTSSVSYNPPAPTAAQISVTLVAISKAQTTVSQTVTITVTLPPKFATTVLQSGANGVSYTQTITLTGGVAPYAYAITSGSLPTCLSLNIQSNTLSTTISGRPCGSGTSNFTLKVTDSGGVPPISQAFTITISPAPPLTVATTFLKQGFVNLPYSDSVAPQGGVGPYAFALVPGMGTLPPGLGLNATTGQILGTPTAATAVPTPTFQVKITDSTLPASQTAIATLSITITTPQSLSFTGPSSLADGAVATSYTSAPLQATGGVPPYNWTMAQGQFPSGLTLSTLNGGNGIVSGVPVLAGTSSFTVQVADSQIPPHTAVSSSLSIKITAGTANSNSLFKGAYSFLFNGFDKNGPVAVVGAIFADGNGIITGGEDTNRVSTDPNLPGVVTGVSLTGTYSVGKDGRGTMKWNAAAPPGGAALTTDYDLVLDSSGNARFFEDNTNAAGEVNPPGDRLGTHGEGILKPVLASSFGTGSLNGNYVFEFTGPATSDSSGKPEALAGRVNADGARNLTSGMSDLNDAGTFSSQVISGNFALISNIEGAAQFVLQPPGKPQITLTFRLFFVSSSDLFLMEVDSPTTSLSPPRLSGEMILQQPTIQFGQNILNGTSVVTGTGLDGTKASVFAGLLSSTLCDGIAPVPLSYDQNDGGTITALSFNGTCTVTSNGRVAFQNLGSSAANTRVAAAYLTGPSQGFLIGSDAAVTTGLLEQQSGGLFSDSSVSGGYTLSAFSTANNQVTNVLGQVLGNGAGGFTGVTDEVDPPASGQEAGTVHLNQSFAGSTINTIAASGRGTLTTSLSAGFPTNAIFYVVSPGAFRMISSDSGSPLPPEVIFLDH
jgi:hypothetical protein